MREKGDHTTRVRATLPIPMGQFETQGGNGSRVVRRPQAARRAVPLAIADHVGLDGVHRHRVEEDVVDPVVEGGHGPGQRPLATREAAAWIPAVDLGPDLDQSDGDQRVGGGRVDAAPHLRRPEDATILPPIVLVLIDWIDVPSPARRDECLNTIPGVGRSSPGG